MRMLPFIRIALVAALFQGIAGVKSDAKEPSEAEVIKSTDGLVTRTGEKLTFQIGNKNLVFRDENKCDDDNPHCHRHKLLSYFPDYHALILYTSSYEDTGYMWINSQDLSTTYIAGPPHFSPDGTSFIVAQDAIGEQSSIIQIWHMTSGLPYMHWQYSPLPISGCEFVSWKSNDEVQLRFSVQTDGNPPRKLPARLIRGTPGIAGWHIEVPRTPKP